MCVNTPRARKSQGNQGRRSNKKASSTDLVTVPLKQRDRVAQRLRGAEKDFQAGRFGDVERALTSLVRSYPQEPEIVELYGLTQYRLGHWEQAIEALGEVTAHTGVTAGGTTANTDQLPILADCYRALGDLNRVRAVWDQLRDSSPDADTMTEGRIVMAGALADSGDLTGAIRLLERGPVRTNVVRERHLRIWYALADLYDRAGETQRAKRGFSRITDMDPNYHDSAARLASLRGE